MSSSSPRACYIPCPPHPPLLDHSDYIWRRVQIMKPLIMQFSATSYDFISLRSKYPQTPSVYVPPLISETKFPTHTQIQGLFLHDTGKRGLQIYESYSLLCGYFTPHLFLVTYENLILNGRRFLINTAVELELHFLMETGLRLIRFRFH
jgi:hypothetical protein